MQNVQVVIVGFGLSAVPLVRELELTGTDFLCISEEGDTVWDSLGANGRLDFDLVSNCLSSFFSFELVERYQGDYYPTAKEFVAMRRRWRQEYERIIVNDRVVRVDNFNDHSLVFAASGNVIKATHVVFATGFRRSIHTDLNEIDYDVSNRTFVIDTMGDSANLMISKLVPNYNKIILRTNGFYPLDKAVLMQIGGSPVCVSLSEFECHNLRYVSQDDYSSLIYGGRPGQFPHPERDQYLLGDQFPDTVRRDAGYTTRVLPASGTVVTKYWPIDVYASKFGDSLEDAIADGYLLNDIGMWLMTGRVIVVPKDTPIDFENRTIQWGGFKRRFDEYVAGGDEQPRLPQITINGGETFRYDYRSSFMGVIPSRLSNIYFLGLTRPMVGGAPTVMEMQSLLVHKLITQPEFRCRIRSNLTVRISAYNRHYYGDSPPGARDHVVFYGFYNDELARLIGIDYRPDRICSLSDLVFYYAFPNNTFKYRVQGEYAVDGVKRLVERVNHDFGGFVVILAYMLAGAAVEPSERPAWQRDAERHIFNDLRYKEQYSPFLEHYLDVYRRVNGLNEEETEDLEWESMAQRATATHNRLASNIPQPSSGSVNDALTEENKELVSLLGLGAQPIFYTLVRMEPSRRKAILALLKPQEYDLPYLRP